MCNSVICLSERDTIPRHIVLASGLRDGMYHPYAQRYKEILARDGVTVEERMTGGADENERLLRDPDSGVDVPVEQWLGDLGRIEQSAARIRMAIQQLPGPNPSRSFSRPEEQISRVD